MFLGSKGSKAIAGINLQMPGGTTRMLRKILPVLIFAMCYNAVARQQPPNVILIITDDQGYGDLGITGNPHVKTPVLDKFAKQSIRFTDFYVSPVCAPTRASLMTGRYSLRTGIRDTYNGGATMAATEVTLAEMLKEAGYRTGIFGKWHLGDNYPFRPMDQGFDESVVHLAGGMGQVGDFTTWFRGDRSYFDPVLWQNGRQKSYEGYCSDIFAKEAISFIEENKEGPFFCYLSFNAPHTPLQVPGAYYNSYKDIDTASGFEGDTRPFETMSEKDKEDARRVYAMVSNIDDNVGKLMQTLEALELVENTVVIFMTDNGPQQVRYIAGMKGRKGSVYRGGVRVPFFLSYPAKFRGDRDINITAAHIDLLPTLAEICQAGLPSDVKIDGNSLVSLLQGKEKTFKDRSLFFYWTRKYPERYFNMALQRNTFKLVGHTDYNAPIHNFELFDIEKDPYEQKNLVKQHTGLAEELKSIMELWYHELITSENLVDPPRVPLGNQQANPVILNRNDAEGERGIWAQEEIFGKWRVRFEAGNYNIRFKFIKPVERGGRMYLETDAIINQRIIAHEPGDIIEMNNVQLPAMECDLIPFYAIHGRQIFPFWVEVDKIN